MSLRIIHHTTSSTKTLTYLLLVIFLPIIGIFFYFSFGINYHKRQLYGKKLIQDDVLRSEMETKIIAKTERQLTNAFQSNLTNAEKIYMETWLSRPGCKKLLERLRGFYPRCFS